MLKIGVSSCFFYPDPSRKVFGHKSLSYFENDMARYLVRDDVMPILIPDFQESSMKHFLKEMDGIVFQGGSDIAPSSYGEKPILENRWPGDPYRDEYELTLLDYALRSELPVLGICRGFQLMNVYFGGTLYQDIGTQLPKALEHRNADTYDQLSHELKIKEGSLFDRLHPERGNHPLVNTVHHQAIKDIGQGLEVQAVSPEDDIIEAFTVSEYEEGRVMGVQWHPEFFHNYKNGKLMDENAVYEQFLFHCRKST